MGSISLSEIMDEQQQRKQQSLTLLFTKIEQQENGE
jgi:hypothetical protein